MLVGRPGDVLVGDVVVGRWALSGVVLIFGMVMVLFVLSKFVSLRVVFGVLISGRQLFFVCLMSSRVDFGGLVSDRQMFFVQTFLCVSCVSLVDMRTRPLLFCSRCLW